jgi:DNA-binding CsgD family transcriptional regulator
MFGDQVIRTVIDVSTKTNCICTAPSESSSKGGFVDAPQSPDELVLEDFLRLRNRSSGPLVGVSDRIMITNAGASELLESGDRAALWEWSRSGQSAGKLAPETSFVLSNGLEVTVRGTLIGGLDSPVGAVIRLAVKATGPQRRNWNRTEINEGSLSWCHDGQPAQPSYGKGYIDPVLFTGWVDLTDTERAAAELVARGLTNREVAQRMFLSRHTIDSHLRQVFRKLSIRSRVELARLVGEHYETLRNRIQPIEPLESVAS